MQLIIKNTHIFDNKIQEEFREFIKLKKDKINASKSYKLTIIYNDASVLERDEFYFDNSIYSNAQTKDEDKKRSALRA